MATTIKEPADLIPRTGGMIKELGESPAGIDAGTYLLIRYIYGALDNAAMKDVQEWLRTEEHVRLAMEGHEHFRREFELTNFRDHTALFLRRCCRY